MRGSIIILPVIRIERHDTPEQAARGAAVSERRKEATLDQLVRERQPIPANVVALRRGPQRQVPQPTAEPRPWK